MGSVNSSIENQHTQFEQLAALVLELKMEVQRLTNRLPVSDVFYMDDIKLYTGFSDTIIYEFIRTGLLPVSGPPKKRWVTREVLEFFVLNDMDKYNFKALAERQKASGLKNRLEKSKEAEKMAKAA